MNKLFLFGLVFVFFSGCSMFGAKEVSETNKQPEVKQTEVKQTAKFTIGEMVVAKWSQNSFYEGKVESINDAKIKVKWNDGSNPSDVDSADVFAIPKTGVKPEVKVGDFVLAKIASGSYWNGAEVSSIDGDIYVVKVNNEQTSNVSAEKIIKIPADVAANFKDKVKLTDLLKEVQSKKPNVPAGYKPIEGERVIGEWAVNSWYQAKVQKVSGDKATLAWEDGTRPLEISLEKVIPMPNEKAEMPKENQFILAKPESGSKWVYAQIISVNAGKIEIKTVDGKTRSIKAGEFVLLH